MFSLYFFFNIMQVALFQFPEIISLSSSLSDLSSLKNIINIQFLNNPAIPTTLRWQWRHNIGQTMSSLEKVIFFNHNLYPSDASKEGLPQIGLWVVGQIQAKAQWASMDQPKVHLAQSYQRRLIRPSPLRGQIYRDLPRVLLVNHYMQFVIVLRSFIISHIMVKKSIEISFIKVCGDLGVFNQKSLCLVN